ncbi:MAG: phage portal protein [Candidatus Caldarchaeum sp.]
MEQDVVVQLLGITVPVTVTRNISEAVKRYYLYYSASEATREQMYQEFVRRFSTNEKGFPMRWFIMQNYIKRIIDKRVEAIPKRFDIIIDPERAGGVRRAQHLHRVLLDWLNAPNFGGNRNFWQQQGFFLLLLEITGNLFLKAVLETVNGSPVVTVGVMDTGNVMIYYDPNRLDTVFAYVFSYQDQYLDPNGQWKVDNVTEIISAKQYIRLVNNQLDRSIPNNPAPNRWGVIPVTHIVNEEQLGTPLGRSGVEDLIEPQNMINAVLTDLRMANKSSVFPMFVGHSLREPNIVLQPGRFIPLHPGGVLQPISLATNTTALQLELEHYIRDIHEKGRVTQQTEENLRALGNAPSGKALLVLTQDGIQYITEKIELLKAGWRDLFTKVLLMMGEISEYDPLLVNIVYPPLELQEKPSVSDKIKTLILLNESGKISDEQLLRELRRNGYLPDDGEQPVESSLDRFFWSEGDIEVVSE